MARYQKSAYFKPSNGSEFTERQQPGSEAEFAGIYRCVVCGDEIGIAKTHKLPPQNHHQHRPGLGNIEWQLIAAAESQA